ncbi:N-6 DNA methylase [Luteimonas sp. BDR2-5]|uniref:N-6 DNA methylase n=1 Tax=Proluteimonas luteida TaxID=2878685 RepID=UPI001E4F2D8E|nr:N-6 DNA methylase [Luteimonas sp. BDR2-5]MCD9026818.1 N-6 DNA methylase [Luteimonas sp. BDR2-5]
MTARRSKGIPFTRPGKGDERQALVRLIRQLARSRGPARVFADFVELASLAMSNAVDKTAFDVREARYHEISRGYTREEFARFPEMLGLLALAMKETGFDDVLGGLYMALELGNARTGQFFTPYTVSRMMTLMLLGNEPELPPHGFFDVVEPACGAGGMVVAMADALKEAGVNYQRHLHVTCVDVDLRCVHMTYLQAALLHIPAIVVHGNSLSDEVWSCWYTPAHVLGGWGLRVAQHRKAGDLHPAQSA